MPTSARALHVGLLAFALAGCGQAQQPAQAPPPPPTVTVANPIKRTITDHDEYVGRFVAVTSVEVRARVSGYLEKVHFTDGQIGQAGRSPVHHRPAAVPEHARAGARQSHPGASPT